MSQKIFDEVRAEFDADVEGDADKSWSELLDLIASYREDALDECGNGKVLRENLIALATIPLRMLAKLDAEGLPWHDIVQPPSPPEPQERLAPPLPDANALMAEAECNVKDGVDPMSLVPSGRQFLHKP
jgi:hypothetical protein